MDSNLNTSSLALDKRTGDSRRRRDERQGFSFSPSFVATMREEGRKDGGLGKKGNAWMKFESHVSKILKPETFFFLLLVFFF